MGDTLWVDEKNKVRRRGTTIVEFKSALSNTIKVSLIYEELQSCLGTQSKDDIYRHLTELNFDYAGYKVSEFEPVIGKVQRLKILDKNVDHWWEPFQQSDLIPENSNIFELLGRLKNKEVLFVQTTRGIEGIIHRTDIQKPIFRIAIFGIITLFELYLQYWIKKDFPGEIWKEKISEGRINLAVGTFKKTRKKNEELELIYFLQICDKIQLFGKTNFYKSIISRLLLKISKQEYERIGGLIEELRNALGHSQPNLFDLIGWDDLIKSLYFMLNFLEISDEMINIELKATP